MRVAFRLNLEGGIVVSGEKGGSGRGVGIQ